MKATELNADQLDQLRQAYNYEVNNSTALTDSSEIPDAVVLDYFAEMNFVEDDFFN